MSDCRKHQGTTYNWCRYWKGEKLTWDKCSAAEGRTVTGRKCRSECTFRINKYTCYTHRNVKKECSPVVSLQSCIVQNRDRSRVLGVENMRNNSALGPICFVSSKDDQRRRKRSGSRAKELCASSRLANICGKGNLEQMQYARTDLMNYVGANVGDVKVLRPNVQEIRNPIAAVFRRQFRVGVYRTEHLYATIRSEHLMSYSLKFRGKNTTLEYLRTEMNARANDDRGYLLSNLLGGVPDDYNLVPQTEHINRRGRIGYQSDWSEADKKIRQFFAPSGPGVNGGGYVEYNMMVSYEQNDSGRPDSFWVIVVFVFQNSHLSSYYQSIEFFALNEVNSI